eukprot:89040-Prymnesium_polylepis.1
MEELLASVDRLWGENRDLREASLSSVKRARTDRRDARSALIHPLSLPGNLTLPFARTWFDKSFGDSAVASPIVKSFSY